MQLIHQDAPLFQSIEATFEATPSGVIGIAVSGGGDSMALLHLLHRWAQSVGVTLQVVTINHGLRVAAAQEAEMVAKFCAELGVEQTTLHWRDWDGTGNLQDQARRARYRLMANWAKARGIKTVALGHTRDDQAETFLMRLARGSGVDGLSGMAPNRQSDGVTWIRPLLLHMRQELRDYLNRHHINWIEDPTNEDERFERVKIRKALRILADLGLDAERLAKTAQDLQPARRALELQTQAAAQKIATIEHGDVVFDPVSFGQLPPEIHSRLLSHALGWVSSARYRPRRHALTEVEINIHKGQSSTLHGCRIVVKKSEIRITREHQAVKDAICATDAIWDNRWQFLGPDTKGLELRVLGEAGLVACPEWRAAAVPRISLLASPAVWKKQTLIAAPMAGLANDWAITALFGLDHFISSIISH